MKKDTHNPIVGFAEEDIKKGDAISFEPASGRVSRAVTEDIPTVEDVVEEFEEEFVVSHPGDSGPGGNDPQEPVHEIQYESPNEVIDWLRQALIKRDAQMKAEGAREWQEKVAGAVQYFKEERKKDWTMLEDNSASLSKEWYRGHISALSKVIHHLNNLTPHTD